MKPTPVPAFACCCRLSTVTAVAQRAALLAQANQRRNVNALTRNHA